MEANSVNGLCLDHGQAQPAPSTVHLESLQSTEQRKLMDLVDQLRRVGLNSILPLPQIVVCGDQSSGKSSTLEAVTGLRLPMKENLCTRFATEFIMRHGTALHLSCKISPVDSRPEDEQTRLRAFSRSTTDPNELPAIIDEATTAMGLGPDKAFSRDALSIEICGPNYPQLTLVDLPGLVHAPNKSQTEEDVELTKSLVQKYISKSRTIILAVISAKNDFANQIILKMCRSHDPWGARTLGVITKPDYLKAGSEYESSWLDLALNEDIPLELGWHLLRNRADGEQHLSFQERNANERSFFSKGVYQSLPWSMKGIDTFRQRLSELLFDHLKKELPTLKLELDEMSRKNSLELDALGRPRSCLTEQKAYLTGLFTSAWDILRMGINGNYDNDFFAPMDTEVSVDEGCNALKIRAVIQHLNVQFVKRMRQKGHKYQIEKAGVSSKSQDRSLETSFAPEATENNKLSPTKAIQWVVDVMRRTRGRELAGTFNPQLISHLFWSQSEPWESLAHSHLNSVAEKTDDFVRQVVDEMAAPEVKKRLWVLIISPALDRARMEATEELKRLIADKKRHPITYNHYFTDTLQKLQQERHAAIIAKATKDCMVSVRQKIEGGHEAKSYIEPERLKTELKSLIDPDMERFSAQQALDAHEAYYKDEMKYFIGVVTKQVVERHLVAPLAEVLSPNALAWLGDKEIQDIAAESEEAVRMREHLDSRKKMLESGRGLFSAALGEHPYQYKGD